MPAARHPSARARAVIVLAAGGAGALVGGGAGAQPPAAGPAAAPAAAPAADTAPPFARARRLSDADLAKKRQGTFLTGLPDLSSDPVAGFGYGARVNVIGTACAPTRCSPTPRTGPSCASAPTTPPPSSASWCSASTCRSCAARAGG
jgi:hypothetical protein